MKEYREDEGTRRQGEGRARVSEAELPADQRRHSSSRWRSARRDARRSTRKGGKGARDQYGHGYFETLKDAFKNDGEKFRLYTGLLYGQALLIEGLPLEDPVEFANGICRLMTG